MKIPDHAKVPLVKKKKTNRPPPDPERERFNQRCKEINKAPSTIRHRMRRYNLSEDEALAWQPTPRSVLSRQAKEKSHWRFLGDIHRGRDV